MEDVKQYTREELEEMNWQEVRSVCQQLGLPYGTGITKADSIDSIVAKTNKACPVVFKKNFLQYKRGERYLVSSVDAKRFREMKLVR